MEPPFHTLKTGPFKTKYHKSTAREMLVDLEEYLRRTLLPQVTISFQATEGSLTPVVNENRFCGPGSLVKDTYKLKFRFLAYELSEHTEAELRYRPAQHTFTIVSKPGLYLWTIARQKKRKELLANVEALCQRILRKEPNEASCPVCSGPISIVDSPALFDVTCPRGCFNYSFHRDPKSQEFLHGHFFVGEPDPSGALTGFDQSKPL